jgi:hypothetical protein
VQLFTRSAARVLFSNQRLQRWCFDVELLYLAQLLGIPVVETSVNWTEISGDARHACCALHDVHRRGSPFWGLSKSGSSNLLLICRRAV